MKIEILKAYKNLQLKDIVNVDEAYGAILVKKGVAKDASEKAEKADKAK